MAAKELFNTTLLLDANLVAYYRLNSGALTTDSKGSNTLTNNNSVAEGIGKFGGCADTGTTNANKYLSVLSDFGINGGSCSISLWFKSNIDDISGLTYQALFSLSDSETKTRFSINYFNDSGTKKIGFYRTRSAVADDGFSVTLNMGVSNFYHLVLTYDGTNIRGYVNGSQVGSPTAASGNGNASLVDKFMISSNNNNNNNPDGLAVGLTDDVAVFSDVLSDTEVYNLYNGNLSARFNGNFFAFF